MFRESMVNTTNIINEDIYIDGFSPEAFRSDKGPNTRNKRVCLYFKESLPIKERSNLEDPKLSLRELLFFRTGHPNISNTKFNEYLDSLEKIANLYT